MTRSDAEYLEIERAEWREFVWGPSIDHAGHCPVCKRDLDDCHIDQPGSCTLGQIKAHYGRMERLQRAAR